MDISQFLKTLGDRRKEGVDALVAAVSVYAQHVTGDAQEITPRDTGFLAASGIALPAEIDSGGMIACKIGFNAGYAVFVHENLTARHDAPGQAKFLETAIRTNAPGLLPFVAKRLEAAIK